MPRWSESSPCPSPHLPPLPILFGTCFATKACFPFPPAGKVGTGEKPVISAPMFTPTPALPRRGGGSPAAHGKSLTAACVPNSVPLAHKGWAT